MYFWGSMNRQVGLGCLGQLIFWVLRKTSVFCDTMFISWGRTPKMDVKRVRGEAIASKLIFPHLPLFGNDYLHEKEVTLKKRLILELLENIVVNFPELVQSVQIKPQYFMYEVLSNRIRVFPLIAYDVANLTSCLLCSLICFVRLLLGCRLFVVVQNPYSSCSLHSLSFQERPEEGILCLVRNIHRSFYEF